MIWSGIFGISVIVILIVLFQWPKMNKNQKKEKIAFLSLTAMSYLLAILLILFPDMVGPTQLIDGIFKPLGQLLEQKK